MSGHSKWSQIKRQKAVTDQKRGAVFTKLGKIITIAAKEGGGDLSANFKLRLAVDKAKAANMPKDNIDRAIKRGIGELAGGELHELIYEAFGPGGVALIIKTLTDNKNRTVAEIKHILGKHNGRLGEPGSSLWQFKEWGVIRLGKTGLDVDQVTLEAIELGAQDVIEEEDNILIKTSKEDLQILKEALEKNDFLVDYAEIDLLPDNYIDVASKTAEQLQKLFEALDDSEDVNDYYHNAKLS